MTITDGPPIVVTSTPGPYDGARQAATAQNYTSIASSENFLFVGEMVWESSQSRSRLARIPVVGGSVAGQTPDRDVLLGTGFSDSNQGHRGVPVGCDESFLATNFGYHHEPFAARSTNDLDPDNLEAITGISESTVSYVKYFRNHHSGEMWMRFRSAFREESLYRRDSVTGEWSTVNVPIFRVGANAWCYSSNQSLVFGPDGLMFGIWFRYMTGDPRYFRDTYIAKSVDNGETWQNMAGTTRTLPLNSFDADQDNALPWGNHPGASYPYMVLDSLNRPMIFGLAPIDGNPASLWVTRWNGSAWISDELSPNVDGVRPGIPTAVTDGERVGVVFRDAASMDLTALVTDDDGANWTRRSFASTADNPVRSLHSDASAFPNHGRHRLMTCRSTLDAVDADATDATASMIYEFTLDDPPVSSLTTPGGTIAAAAGGTLTAG